MSVPATLNANATPTAIMESASTDVTPTATTTASTATRAAPAATPTRCYFGRANYT